MADSLPPTPLRLKPIQHYLKAAVEHDKRDPIVSYYCRIFAMQKAMEIDKKSPECRNFLAALMDLLEQTKNQTKDVSAIQSEIVGHAYIEDYAIKLFHYADTEDRASHFGKNVVKAFYTAGVLFDVLTNFGELSEDLERNRKYAKWKAIYIYNCLKTGETPHPGPLKDETGEVEEELKIEPVENEDPYAIQTQPEPSELALIPTTSRQASGFSSSQPSSPSASVNYSRFDHDEPASKVTKAERPEPLSAVVPKVPQAGGAVVLKSEDYAKAMKYCKFATSALQFEDSKTAIENLTKALNLLINGRE